MILLVSTSIPYYLLVNSHGVNSTSLGQNPLAPSSVLGSGSMVASESMNRRVKRSYMFGIPRDGSFPVLGYHSCSVHAGETGPTGSFLAQNVDNAGKNTRQIIIHHLLSCMLGAWGLDLLQCVMRTEVWRHTYGPTRLKHPSHEPSFAGIFGWWRQLRCVANLGCWCKRVQKWCWSSSVRNRGTTNNFHISTCFFLSAYFPMPLNSLMFSASPITIIGFRSWLSWSPCFHYHDHHGIMITYLSPCFGSLKLADACRGCSWWPWL